MQTGLTLSISRAPADIRDAHSLRHRVFVEEMGASAHEDDHDAACDHLMLRDPARPDLGVVGTLRVGYGDGGFYTEQEFDLAGLRQTGWPMAEPGRTCLHPNYRGGAAAFLLFQGMLDHLKARQVRVLVGTASFPGADAQLHMPALRRLHQDALAPAAIRPKAIGPNAVAVSGTADRSAMRGVPPLIKTYLRAGAWIGQGAWVDHAFNTVDVCMVLDMERLTLPSAARNVTAATVG